MELINRGTGTGDFIKAKLDNTRNGNPRLAFCFALDGSTEYKWINVILTSPKSYEVLHSVMRGIYPVDAPIFEDPAAALAYFDALKATTVGKKYKIDWGETNDGYTRVFANMIAEGGAPWQR